MGKRKTFIRENRITCGDSGYQMVELFQYTDEGQSASERKRRRKENITPEKIRKMNDKRARRYFHALLNTNFGEGDIHLTLTYAPENLPEIDDAINKKAKRYLERVRRRRAKLGLDPLKYVIVTEFGVKKSTGEVVRLHHHIVMNGGIDRDDLELMWTDERIDWARLEREKAAGTSVYRDSIRQKRLGYANADRLKCSEDGLGRIAKYLMKYPAGKKRWSASRNLEKPTRTKNDSKYSRRKLTRACCSGDIYTREWWEKNYPGYTLAGSAAFAVDAKTPDDMNDWNIYAKLRRVMSG